MITSTRYNMQTLMYYTINDFTYKNIVYIIFFLVELLIINHHFFKLGRIKLDSNQETTR